MLRSFRYTAALGRAALAEAALVAQGFALRPLPFYTQARELVAEPFPLGSSLAARFGHIYIQDASSMLPALALAAIVQADAGADARNGGDGPLLAPLLALDMCASPGGKSSLLAALLGPRALVLANEPAQKRLLTLRRNLELMNVLNSATLTQPGQDLPLPSAGAEGFAGFDYILLDPPCSGWGTVEKNPRVATLWQGDRLGPLAGLQRLLLREAARLLRPGGALVYSTCTTNVQENEEQIAWALDALNAELGGALGLLALTPFAGFDFDAPLPPLAGQPVLRVPQGSGLGQGFFIAALRKGPGAPPILPRLAAAARPGGKKQAARPAKTQPPAQAIAPEALASPLCDFALLPPGELQEQGGEIYFKHRAGLTGLPPGFGWRGFPLGRNMRLSSGLHALLPDLEAARARGAAVLDAEDPELVRALVSGQSLKFAAPGSELGLYLNGLPLCRLKARGGRVFI